MDKPEAKSKPLPAATLIVSAFVIPWLKRTRMAQALAFPALGLLLIGLVPRAPKDSPFVAFYILLGMIYVMLGVLFVVTCHRLVLLGDQDVPRFGLLKWTWRETRFVGWSVVNVLIPLGAALPIILLLTLIALPLQSYLQALGPISWLGYLGGVPLLYLAARISLVLPATAVDKRPDLGWAWRCSHGNGWRLVLVVWLLPWVFSFGHELIQPAQATVIGDILITVVGLVLLVIEITALSLSYRELSQNISTQ